MKFRRKSKIQAQLEKDEPFTKRETHSLDMRERNFIRGIQLKENINKKSAIKRYHDYLIGNIKNRKLFRKRVTYVLNTDSPDKFKIKNKETGQFKINRLGTKTKVSVKRRKKIYEVSGYDISRVY